MGYLKAMPKCDNIKCHEVQNMNEVFYIVLSENMI